MNTDLSFRLALAGLLAGTLLLRLAYHFHAGTLHHCWNGPRESWFLRLIRLCALPGLAAFLIYLVYPPWLAWSHMPLPDWLRWLGVALGLAALLLLAWVHHTLGKNFSTPLYIREGHTLVTHGPYRWVRHPMYSAFWLWMLSVGLISANWFLMSFGLLVISLVIIFVTPKEEALLIGNFGAAYTAYRQRTGRLLPRLMPSKP